MSNLSLHGVTRSSIRKNRIGKVRTRENVCVRQTVRRQHTPATYAYTTYAGNVRQQHPPTPDANNGRQQWMPPRHANNVRHQITPTTHVTSTRRCTPTTHSTANVVHQRTPTAYAMNVRHERMPTVYTTLATYATNVSRACTPTAYTDDVHNIRPLHTRVWHLRTVAAYGNVSRWSCTKIYDKRKPNSSPVQSSCLNALDWMEK